MGTLISKIAKASAAVGGALNPDKRNLDSKYDYVSADKILSVAGQALADAGVAVLPSVTTSEVLTFDRGQGKSRYDARVDFVFFLADEESQMEMMWVGYGSDYTVPDKAIYKAITSGHKYFLAKLLNIGAGNEDGEHESGGSSGGNESVAGRINEGEKPCKVCHAPVGKIHASTCTATDETLKSTPPSPAPPTATVTEEFASIPSPKPGQGATAHTNGTNGNGNGKVKQAAAVQSDGTITPATLRKLQAQFAATFGGLDVDDARHWYIEKWTTKHTPDNVRKSASDVTDAEAELMIPELKKYLSGLRSTYEAQSQPQAVPA